MATRKQIDDDFSNAVNLGPEINMSRVSDPCLSRDGLTLFYAVRGGGLGSYDLWMSARGTHAEAFSAPVNVSGGVNSKAGEFSPALSANMLTLMFSTVRDGTGGEMDIWASTRNSIDEDFGPAISLGHLVNSQARDTSPCLSADGLELWFSSNREGSVGARDLWVCRRSSRDVEFGPAKNAGPVINSTGDEESPSLTSDGRYLLFERQGSEGNAG